MSASDIQVNYESLNQSAQVFRLQSERAEALQKSVSRCAQNVINTWEGEGSEAFQAEMQEQFIPQLKRLTHALAQIHATLQQIMQTMQEAEEEAAHRIGREDGEEGSKSPKVGGTEKAGDNTPPPAAKVPVTHQVVPGDTLWAIAQRYGTSVDALVAANNIPNRDLIYPGQIIQIPGQLADAPTANPPAKPADLGASGRSAEQLSQKIDSFNVTGNSKYLPGNGRTFCNIFASDVAKSLGANIPQYVTDSQGKITKYLDANLMKSWLDGNLSVPGSYQQGPAIGWQKVDAATAAKAANEGFVTVVAGHGHMAVVRPGSPITNSIGDLHTAQAGARNFNHGTVSQGWGRWTGEAEVYVFRPPK